MPPKQSKADLSKKQKIVEAETFGLKNKSKSKNVQKYVQRLQQSVQPKPHQSKIAAEKKEDEKAREKELRDLFKIAVSQPKSTCDRSSTDWDRAWSSFRKQAKKKPFSRFSPDKYVSWNPRRSEYPLSEEIDPIKKTERSNLELWTSPRFTLSGAIVVVTLLLIYTLLALPPK